MLILMQLCCLELCQLYFGDGLLEPPQIPKKSTLRRWDAQILASHPHGIIKDQKSTLEMGWRPRYENLLRLLASKRVEPEFPNPISPVPEERFTSTLPFPSAPARSVVRRFKGYPPSLNHVFCQNRTLVSGNGTTFCAHRHDTLKFVSTECSL